MNHPQIDLRGPSDDIFKTRDTGHLTFIWVVVNHVFLVLEPPAVKVEKLALNSADEELQLAHVESVSKGKAIQLELLDLYGDIIEFLAEGGHSQSAVEGGGNDAGVLFQIELGDLLLVRLAFLFDLVRLQTY